MRAMLQAQVLGVDIPCKNVYVSSHIRTLTDKCLQCCRANFRVLTLLVGISAFAACNALYVPLRLEQVIHTHPRSVALLQAAEADGWLQEYSNITTSGNTVMALMQCAMAIGCLFSDATLVFATQSHTCLWWKLRCFHASIFGSVTWLKNVKCSEKYQLLRITGTVSENLAAC